jgi:CCR4-NOT transcription complex subunit 1
VDALGFASSNAALYKGMLRILLVLLHDYPEFLTAYYFSFVDVLPLHCIQLKNLILSAFPTSMRLPDPFTPNLKLESLPDSSVDPLILSDLHFGGVQEEVEAFLRRKHVGGADAQAALERIRATTQANAAIVHALVLIVGLHAVAHPGCAPLAMELFQHLLKHADAQEAYVLVSAMANQLRYSNSHTLYFSGLVLELFALNPDVVTR